MVFSSSTFLFVFLPCVLSIYFLLHQRYRNIFLLLASFIFYTFGEPSFVLIMAASIIFNYVTALLIAKYEGGIQKSLFLGNIFFNLSLLFIFKYLNFTTRNLGCFFSDIPRTNIELPIGISFFTFQAISYVVDVYRKAGKAQKNILNVGLYISFFPQLIAGPIVRYETIEAEITGRSIKWSDFCTGTKRFLQGLIKKIILANNLSVVADAAFAASPGDLSVCLAWLGMVCYTLQIYYDFSGYSDMAIGLGRMFGFHFNENFNYPYISKSVTEFWRRWHISLGSWFKDYVYLPLGGSKVDTQRKHLRNLFIVWFLTGLWHGASWNFVAWGLMYFIILVLEKYIVHPEKIACDSIKRYLWQVFTMLSVAFGWILFRAEGFRHAMHYILAEFGLQGNAFFDEQAVFYLREYLVLILLALAFCFPILQSSKWQEIRKKAVWMSGAAEVITYAILFLISISYLVMGAHNPFIYFNF